MASRRRLAMVAVAVGAVAALCATALTVAESSGSTSGPPHPSGPLGIVILGDSVPAGTACHCTAFGALLGQDLRQQSKRRVTVSSFAQPGLDSSGLQAQVRSDATVRSALRHASTVTVTIGANDFDPTDAASACHGSGTTCFDRDLNALPGHLKAALAEVRALAGRQAHILVTGYWNVFLDGDVAAKLGPNYRTTSDALTRRVNAVIDAAADQVGGAYVDLYRAFRGDGDADDTALLAADGDHPSPAGHALIAAVLARALLGS